MRRSCCRHISRLVELWYNLLRRLGFQKRSGFMQRTIARSILAAFAVAASLTACPAEPLGDASTQLGDKLKSMPESLGGLPPDTPKSPATPYQYPAVHDMPPPRT